MKAITISYDNDGGEMTAFTLSLQFLRESALMRADVLKDVMVAVARAYGEAKRDAFNVNRAKRGKGPL